MATHHLIFAVVLCIVGLAVRRLYFHPLSKVPGPRLAAITGLYEFHYQCIKGAKYAFRIEDMHAQYGSIVRINPNEVHIQDPEYYDELYNVNSRLDKDKWYYSFIGSSEAGFGTSDAELHRARRKAMSRFFSPSAIAKVEESVRGNVLKLCQRLEEFREAGTPVNLSNAFRCLAQDTVTTYCMPRGSNLLDSVDFAEEYNAQSRGISYIAVFHRHIPIILPIFMAMPRWVLEKVATNGGLQAFDFQTDLANQAHIVSTSKYHSDDSVLQGIANSDVPPSDKSTDRLTQEARTLVGAGSETTGSTLEHIIFGILSNPGMHQRLQLELKEAITSSGSTLLDSYTSLHSLPYLGACIKEGLRLAIAVSGRLPRVDPRKSHTYKSFVLPPGTVMSMSPRLMHLNPLVFHDPHLFNPERWLQASDDADADELKILERSFVPFSRGSRGCIGKDLAMVTLYLTTANLMEKFGMGRMELWETDFRDIEMEYDLFAPFPRVGATGVKVMLS